MTESVYRIQDADGRGPYKPGWSHVWQEMRCLVPDPGKPTFFEEFPGILDKINIRFDTVGGHFGCAFRSLEQLQNWFTRKEITKLAGYGYHIITLVPDEVLAESPNQLVFWCKNPLKSIGTKYDYRSIPA